MEFIPADDEKGPGLRTEAAGKREAGQESRDARQISLIRAAVDTVWTFRRLLRLPASNSFRQRQGRGQESGFGTSPADGKGQGPNGSKRRVFSSLARAEALADVSQEPAGFSE